ncbi:hypothetical protein E2C01_004418 [Portunus trituberculatus]|uniref:Uncharacterized protein n=1 Tax=Portunus trituberculatus TaxID=210409 RepID=A0A5B7CWB6_PORTR|nr:hypothetical protein [Portunus trituberculatus]
MVPQKAGIAGTVSQQAVKLQEYKARRNKNIMDPRGVVIFVWLMTSPWCCAGQRAARKTNDANKLSIVPPGYLQELAPWPQDGSPLMINFSLKVNAIMETDEKQTFLREIQGKQSVASSYQYFYNLPFLYLSSAINTPPISPTQRILLASIQWLLDI